MAVAAMLGNQTPIVVDDADRVEAAALPAWLYELAGAGGSSAQDGRQPERSATPADAVGEVAWTPPIPPDAVAKHIADPRDARSAAEAELGRTERETDRTYARSLIGYLDVVLRPNVVRLSLADVVRRAMANNYVIRISSYNPAIETTRIVEAEAAFDAAFFMSMLKNIQDTPTGSELRASDVNSFNLTGGVRKLLPSGATATVSSSLDRLSTSLSFQQINPEYRNNLVFEIRQPLARGFGLDFNRSAILVARNNRLISQEAFKRQVRQTLADVESAYWRLVQQRREVTIQALLLASFEQIYDYLDRRKEFDTYRVQLSDTKARLEAAKADFIRLVNLVRNSEDRLIGLMNDGSINLAGDVEIMPTDFPALRPVVIDRLAAAQTALDNRSEITEARLRIKNAQIAVGRAENLALPRVDVVFRYTIDGLGVSADDAFDQVTQHDFTEYFVGVEFEVPIGNRGARAAEQRERLLHAQAMASLKNTFEQVILDVNLRTREIDTSFKQIVPSYNSAEASDEQVGAIIARAERKDFNTLSNELGARQSLAANRQSLLTAIVNYGIAAVELERAKGTLLEYNSVIAEAPGE